MAKEFDAVDRAKADVQTDAIPAQNLRRDCTFIAIPFWATGTSTRQTIMLSSRPPENRDRRDVSNVHIKM